MNTNALTIRNIKEFETLVEHLISVVADDTKINEAAHKFALQRSGLTEGQLEMLGENAGGLDEHPRYTLYWSSYSSYLMTLLNAAGARYVRVV